MTPPRLAIGVMSGTSMDGIDVAAITTDGEQVTSRDPGRTYAYPSTTREALFDLIRNPDRIVEPSTAATQTAALEVAVTQAHGDAIAAYLTERGIAAQDVAAIGLHGQTVLHRPAQRFTRQLGHGQTIADRFNVPTVYRFRHADVAAGGQGAPLVPVYHRALSAALPNGHGQPLAILNLGGVGNVTYIDATHLIAFDTGPANALIDDFLHRRRGLAFDPDGQIAASGRSDDAAVAALMADPYFSRPAPKSLDRQHFNAALTHVAALADADGAATLTAFTVETIHASLSHMPQTPRRWLVGGGGRRNGHVMRSLAARLRVPVEPVEHVGWDGDQLEAEAFAFLAVRALRGLPLSYPTTTGVPHPMPGGDCCQPRARP